MKNRGVFVSYVFHISKYSVYTTVFISFSYYAAPFCFGPWEFSVLNSSFTFSPLLIMVTTLFLVKSIIGGH
jgi:hypothetical protein